MNTLTDLQGTVTNVDARNKILNLIGNIFTLQTERYTGKATTKEQFNFFVVNILKGLHMVKTLINSKETDEEKTAVQLNAILTLVKNFRTTLTSGDVKNIIKVLDQILTKMSVLEKQTKITSVTKVITTLTKTLTVVHKTVEAGKFDISNIWDEISKVQKSLREITSDTSANVEITKLLKLVMKFQTIVDGGDTKKIDALLIQV